MRNYWIVQRFKQKCEIAFLILCPSSDPHALILDFHDERFPWYDDSLIVATDYEGNFYGYTIFYKGMELHDVIFKVPIQVGLGKTVKIDLKDHLNLIDKV